MQWSVQTTLSSVDKLETRQDINQNDGEISFRDLDYS